MKAHARGFLCYFSSLLQGPYKRSEQTQSSIARIGLQHASVYSCVTNTFRPALQPGTHRNCAQKLSMSQYTSLQALHNGNPFTYSAMGKTLRVQTTVKICAKMLGVKPNKGVAPFDA